MAAASWRLQPPSINSSIEAAHTASGVFHLWTSLSDVASPTPSMARSQSQDSSDVRFIGSCEWLANRERIHAGVVQTHRGETQEVPRNHDRKLLEYRQIILFQMKSFVRHHDHFRRAVTLESLESLPFFILEQVGDGRVRSNHNALLLGSLPDSANLTKNFIGHGRRGLGIPPPFAIVTGLRQGSKQILPHAFP